METPYRIVQKIRTVTGITQNMGEVDETSHEELSAIVLEGTTSDSPEEIRRWTSESLRIDTYVSDSYEGGHEEYLYFLQIKKAGEWRDVKALVPFREPYDDPEIDDFDDDAFWPEGVPRHEVLLRDHLRDWRDT